jgi:hypothetical protein
MTPKPRAYGSKLERLQSSNSNAEPRHTFDKSPVRESRTPGSVGEALSNQRLYPTNRHLQFSNRSRLQRDRRVV